MPELAPYPQISRGSKLVQIDDICVQSPILSYHNLLRISPTLDSIKMYSFQSFPRTLSVLSLLQITRSSAQLTGSVSNFSKSLSYTLEISQTSIQNSTAALQTSPITPQSFTAAFSQVSSTSSPTCDHPRSPTDPNVAALQASVASDTPINKACNPSYRNVSSVPWTHTFYALNDVYYFNTSLQDVPSVSAPSSIPSGVPRSEDCTSSFNAIFSSCVTVQSFWGGWVERSGINYTSE